MRGSMLATGLVVACVVSVGAGEGADIGGVAEDSGAKAVWSSTFGGTSSDKLASVQQTSDGGYIVAGRTKSWGNGLLDGWVMKLDSSGNKVWSKTFGGSADDYFRCVQQTSDGGYVVAGYEGSWGQGEVDGWVMKLDSSGNKVWSKTFGGSQDDMLESVQQTSDGGYIVAGVEASWGQGYGDAWVMKLNSSGGKVWSKTFGGVFNDAFWSVRQTSDGGYIVAGEEQSWGMGFYDAWVMKLDSNGNRMWSKTFGGTSEDHFWSVRQTSGGGYVIAGRVYSWGAGGYDGWVVKLNSSGGKTWAVTFGGTNNDSLFSIDQTSDGGYVVGGHEYSWGMGSFDGWVVRLSSTGAKVWGRTLGGTDDDSFRSVEQTSDGGYVLSGYEKSWGSGGYDGWVVKLSSSGN